MWGFEYLIQSLPNISYPFLHVWHLVQYCVYKHITFFKAYFTYICMFVCEFCKYSLIYSFNFLSAWLIVYVYFATLFLLVCRNEWRDYSNTLRAKPGPVHGRHTASRSGDFNVALVSLKISINNRVQYSLFEVLLYFMKCLHTARFKSKNRKRKCLLLTF